ncbi:MAG: aldo/keto reductase [Chloroflexi bacterium]|nr:aldo/keto reductase [Chloroflexota bacterium]
MVRPTGILRRSEAKCSIDLPPSPHSAGAAAILRTSMLHTHFPYAASPVSRLGFGAFGFAGVFGAVDEGSAVRSVLHSLERGVTMIDTARGYRPAEAVIGKALQQWSGARPFIASKVNALGPKEQWGFPTSVADVFPRGHITHATETSLRTLGVERIDCMQLHLYWPNWGVEGYWLDELRALRERGLIGAIGVSLPDQRHDVGLPLVLSGAIDSVQTVINIFDPTALDFLVPLCRERGVAVIARCVLDEGGLTGFLTPEMEFAPGDYRAAYFDQGPRAEYIRHVDALRQFVPEHAASLAALALKFVLHDPGVTVAIASMHVTRFADENIAALAEPPLSAEVFEILRRRHRWLHNFYNSKVM